MSARFDTLRIILLIFIFSIAAGGYYSFFRNSVRGEIISPVVFGTNLKESDGTDLKTGVSGTFSFFSRLLSPKGTDSNFPTGAVLGQKTETEDYPESVITTFVDSPEDNYPTAIPDTAPEGTTPTPTATPVSDLSSSSSPTPTPEGSQLTPSQSLAVSASQTVIEHLINRDFSKIYEMMSSEFKTVFSQSDFTTSLSSSVDVISGSLSGVPLVYGNSSEWSEQLINLNLANNSQKNYLLIFHRENDDWKLYATEDKP